MEWIIGVIFLIGIPALILATWFLWLYFRSLYEMRPGPIVQTPLGVFRQWRPGRQNWYGEIPYRDRSVLFFVQNQNGKMNPPLLGGLTHIMNQLAEWERDARTRIPEITNDFTLNIVEDVSNSEGVSLQLVFQDDPEDPCEGTNIRVQFREGAIVGWHSD